MKNKENIYSNLLSSQLFYCILLLSRILKQLIAIMSAGLKCCAMVFLTQKTQLHIQ